MDRPGPTHCVLRTGQCVPCGNRRRRAPSNRKPRVVQQTVKCTVAGRVQGVFYRAATAERASELGIRGWVRNRPDGRVELVAGGDADAVEQLVAWLWQGPPGASVTSVTLAECEQEIPPGFRVAG